MEAMGLFQDVAFTAFLTLLVYFILPKLLSQLGGGYDSTTTDDHKAGFLEQIRGNNPEKSLGVSDFRSMSCDDYHLKEPKGNTFTKDDEVAINNSGVVEELYLSEKGCVVVGVGGGGGDDVEAKVVDECPERPKMDEIPEENGCPLMEEARVTSDLVGDFIREEKVSPTSEAQTTLDSREVVQVGEANYEQGVLGNSGSEISQETDGITSENSKSDDHHHDEEEGFLGDWEGIEKSELDKRFDAAMSFVESKSNVDRIDGNLRLQLYGLQRVAMEGPCHEPQPMALKVSARAKWNAWQKLGNMSGDTAMEEYMTLLSKSIPEWEDKE